MARIINSSYTPILTLNVLTMLEDKVIATKSIKENDVVTNLRYVEDKQVKVITGRVAKINYTVNAVNRNYRNVYNAKSYFASDVRCTSIVIDCSSEYNSCLVTVPTNEIVEDEGVVCDRIRYELSYAISVGVEFTDGVKDTFVISEGQMAYGLSYMSYGRMYTIDAKIAVIKYNVDLTPSSVIVALNGSIREIDIVAITDIDSTEDRVVEDDITNILANDEGGIVYLGAAEFTQPVTVTKNATILGARAGCPATDLVGYQSLEETVITGKIEAQEGVTLTLDGLTLTKDAIMLLTSATEVTLKNCYIADLTPNQSNSYIFRTFETAPSMKLEVDGCYFGYSKSDVSPRMYNAFELQAKLADGSYFKNCYFEKGYIFHNGFNFYDVDEGAHILIENCHWEESKNAMRFGIKGEPTCRFDIINCSYDETPDDGWGGLFLLQPYTKQTTSMANTTINIENLKKPEGQIYYFYDEGVNYMKFTPYNVPTIIVDGVVEVAPEPEPTA